MSTRVRFEEAAARHFSDGEYLQSDGRAPNADQLFGLAAECALKGVLVRLGVGEDERGNIDDRGWWQHIDKLWDEALSFASGRRGARSTRLLQKFDQPFADWSIDQRYSGDDWALSGAALVEHRKAARACLILLERLRNDL